MNEFDSRQQKCKKVEENQAEYNQQMVNQTSQIQRFKEVDTISIKIDRADKKIHYIPTCFLKNINFSNNYATVVTQFGRIKGTISASRLYPCTVTNMTFYKEITLTAACKFAIAE